MRSVECAQLVSPSTGFPCSTTSQSILLRSPLVARRFPTSDFRDVIAAQNSSFPSCVFLFNDYFFLFRSAALTGPCWFCLGSPQVEKHLIISVGLQVYYFVRIYSDSSHRHLPYRVSGHFSRLIQRDIF